MKRDMDLIRKILLDVEGETEIDISEYSIDQLNYHKGLLIEAGFLDGLVKYSSRGGKQSDEIPNIVHVKKMTWSGHEFLDQARDNTVWERAKRYVSEKGQTLSIESIKIALGILIKGSLS